MRREQPHLRNGKVDGVLGHHPWPGIQVANISRLLARRRQCRQGSNPGFRPWRVQRTTHRGWSMPRPGPGDYGSPGVHTTFSAQRRFHLTPRQHPKVRVFNARVVPDTADAKTQCWCGVVAAACTVSRQAAQKRNQFRACSGYFLTANSRSSSPNWRNSAPRVEPCRQANPISR